MYGAILGDIVGSPYEFNRGNKTKDFPLFSNKSEYTDDTVMTIAVAEALLDADDKSDEEVKTTLVHSMQKWGRHSLMRDTETTSSIGLKKLTQNHTIVMEMVQQCACPL